MDLIRQQFVPLKTSKFLTDYLDIVKDYKDPNYIQITWKRFRSVFYAILIESIHFCWLYVYPRDKQDEQFYHFDLVCIAQLPKEVNLMFIAVFMYSGYYIYLMYFCDYTELNHILFQIMVLQSTDKIFRLPKINRKHLIWHQVKRFTTFLTTFFQMFVVASGMKYNLDNNDCNKWFFYV